MRGRLGRTGYLLIGGSITWMASLGAVPATAVGDDPSPTAEAPTSPSDAPSETPSDAPSPSAPAPSPDPDGEDQGGGDLDPQSDASGGDRHGRRAQTAGVDVVDDAFQPSQITVDAGAEVTWTSGGQNPHTVTADDGSFGSGTLQDGDTFSTTLDAAGTFAYYCEFHGGPGGSGMSGVVVVRASGDGGDGSPGAEGTDDLPPTGRDLTAPAFMGLVLAAVGLALVVRGRRVMRHTS